MANMGQWVAQEVSLQIAIAHLVFPETLYEAHHRLKISTNDIDSGAHTRGKPWPKQPETRTRRPSGTDKAHESYSTVESTATATY